MVTYKIEFRKLSSAGIWLGLFLASTDEPIYDMESAELKMTLGEAGSFTFTLSPRHPDWNELAAGEHEVRVMRDEEEIWCGRIMSIDEDMYKSRTYYCEGLLSYLNDTQYPAFDFAGPPEELLEDIITNHNNQCNNNNSNGYKTFAVGKNEIKDPNNYIARSSEYFLSTYEVLKTRFPESALGGYFNARHATEEDKNENNEAIVLDYLLFPDDKDGEEKTNEQTIELGKNILDITITTDRSNIPTAILPLGAEIEQENESDDSSENENDTSENKRFEKNLPHRYVMLTDNSTEEDNIDNLIVKDENLINEYGLIIEQARWEDVTLSSNLKTKAEEYLKQYAYNFDTAIVNAVDLAQVSNDIEPFKLGQLLKFKEYIFIVSEITIDFFNPEKNTIQISSTGKKISTISGA